MNDPRELESLLKLKTSQIRWLQKRDSRIIERIKARLNWCEEEECKLQ